MFEIEACESSAETPVLENLRDKEFSFLSVHERRNMVVNSNH